MKGQQVLETYHVSKNFHTNFIVDADWKKTRFFCVEIPSWLKFFERYILPLTVCSVLITYLLFSPIPRSSWVKWKNQIGTKWYVGSWITFVLENL